MSEKPVLGIKLGRLLLGTHGFLNSPIYSAKTIKLPINFRSTHFFQIGIRLRKWFAAEKATIG